MTPQEIDAALRREKLNGYQLGRTSQVRKANRRTAYWQAVARDAAEIALPFIVKRNADLIKECERNNRMWMEMLGDHYQI